MFNRKAVDSKNIDGNRDDAMYCSKCHQNIQSNSNNCPEGGNHHPMSITDKGVQGQGQDEGPESTKNKKNPKPAGFWDKQSSIDQEYHFLSPEVRKLYAKRASVNEVSNTSETCKDCKGTGKDAGGTGLKCSKCNGTGNKSKHYYESVKVAKWNDPIRHLAMQYVAHDSGDGQVVFHCCFCFTESVRYITKDGIKSFGETVNTTQWVLSAPDNKRTEAEWVEAHIHEFGEQSIMEVTLQRNGREVIVEATPEHRWLVKANLKVREEKIIPISRKGKPRDWRPLTCSRGHEFTEENTRIKKNGTRDCKTCAKLATSVGGLTRSTNRDVMTKDLKPGYRLSSLRQSGVGTLIPNEDGIRHGVVFGDGSAQGKSASVTLWGEKDKQLLKYFPGRRYYDRNTANSSILGTGISGIYVSGNLWAWMKAIPELTESDEYLYGWLAGYFAADGTVSEQGQVSLNSANLAHLEAVRDIAQKIGISTYGITMKMREGFPGRELSALYGIDFVTSTLNEEFFLTEIHRNRYNLRDYDFERLGWTVKSVKTTDRVEKVYCAVVPEYHSFALEHNIWVGNCGSGQVVGQSDGTIECVFCKTCFTVQVQPEQMGMPQTVDGNGYDIPGMPNGQDPNGDDLQVGPNGNPEPIDPSADNTTSDLSGNSDSGFPPDGSDDGSPQDEEDQGKNGSDVPWEHESSLNLSNATMYYLTHEAALNEDEYLRYLAIRYADNKPEVLRQVKASRVS